MGWKERLLERPLSRAVDDQTRRSIEAEFDRRRHEFPIPVKLAWGGGGSLLTIASKWANFLVHFGQDRMVVDAELSLAARVFATESNRHKVIRFINELADELKL